MARAQPVAAAGRSPAAVRLLSDLIEAAPGVRRQVLAQLETADMTALLAASAIEWGTPYALWRDDPVGFSQQVLGEALWSGQRRILSSLTRHKSTAVPSCFGSGKTRSTALAVTWWGAVHPPGTAIVVTIAPRWRQVARQIWPEIRGIVTRADLPGRVDQVQWKLPTMTGLEYTVAYGVAAAPHAEDAVQGIHAPHLLLVVDEAGGISPTIGRNMAGLLTGSDARMIAIGNPPTDDEGSWFEQLCNTDRVNVVPISAHSTPAFTGEQAPRCRSCPPAVTPHSLSTHLVDKQWVADAIADHGADSRYVTAKVHARFSRGGPNTLIPSSWVDAAVTADEPEEGIALDSLGLAGETGRWRVARGSWVRLGVDVAADGGDELVVARAVGDLVTVEHTSAGEANANSVDVAGRVLEQIERAQQLAAAIGSAAAVRVKVDVIGLGWAVASQLERWAEEGRHHAEIVRVDVRESPRRAPEAATLRPARKRDEMWLAMRALLSPGEGTGSRLRLRVDARTAAQLSAPRYSTSSTGETVVESKDSMRSRGIRSPDRGEGAILAVYEPAVRRSRIIA